MKSCDQACAIDDYTVPGGFEMPLAAKKLAATGRYDGIVCAAFVVDGGIYRHEFVANTVVQALMTVGLETGVPCFSLSLTPHHFHEHKVHHDFYYEHMLQKGAEGADAVIMMCQTLGAVAAS